MAATTARSSKISCRAHDVEIPERKANRYRAHHGFGERHAHGDCETDRAKFYWPRHRDFLIGSANRRIAETPIRPRPGRSRAPDTPGACADLPIDASAARTSLSRASESGCPRRIRRRRDRFRTSVRAPQTCIRRTPFFIAAPSNVPPRRASIFAPVEFDRHDVGPRSHLLEPGSERVPEHRDHQLRARVSMADFNLAANSDSLLSVSIFIPSGSLRSAFRARASRDSTACSPSRNIRAISVTPISSTYFRSNTSRCSGLSSARARLNSRSAPGSVRSGLVSDRSRAHQASASRIGANERENFAMRDRAGEGEQRAVAAKKRQRVGQCDEGLLQHVVGVGGCGAERTRDEAADARGVAIEEFVRRIFVAGLEAGDEIALRQSAAVRRRSRAKFSARTHFSVDS